MRLALLGLVVGTGIAAGQPRERDVEVARPELPFDIRRAATEDRIDVSDLARWPLGASDYTALEPTYPIAAVFARDTTWIDLCAAGVRDRTGHAAYNDYLRAWCEVARRDTDAALTLFSFVLRSNVRGLGDAARKDIAHLLVDAGNAQLAQRALATAKIADPAVLDLLAASFADLGRTQDAERINDAALDQTVQTTTARCQRIARRVVLVAKPERFARIGELQPYIADHDCKLLAHELTCWAGGACADYIAEHGIDPELAAIVDVYVAWPSGPVSARRWLMLADEGAGYLGRQGADVLAVTALEGAMRATSCGTDAAGSVAAAAKKISESPYHDRAFDPRLAALASACVKKAL